MPAADPRLVPQHGGPINRRAALFAAMICWLGFGSVALLASWGDTAAFDRAGLLFWRAGNGVPLGPAWLLEGGRDLTALGGVLLRNLFALAAAAALLFMARRGEAARLALTVAGGWLVDDTIKNAVARARPQLVRHLTQAAGPSFPSGHSFNAALVYLAIALTFAALSPRATVRRTIIGAALALSLAVAWSRVWLGVHWPTDAIAGWLGGVGWALAANALPRCPARTIPDARRG